MSNDIKIEESEDKGPANTQTSTAAKKDSSVNGTSSKKMTVGYLDVVVIALIAAFVTVMAYDKFFAGKVVVVDLAGFVKEQTELYAQGKIGKEEITARLGQFQDFIKNQPQNQTVIIKDVVLANGKEIPFTIGTAGKSPADTDKK